MDQWDVVLVHQFRFLYWNLNKLLLTQMLLERKSAVTTVKLQIAGIVLGIKMIIQYLQNCTTRKSVEEVYMFCDSESAIEAVNKFSFSKTIQIPSLVCRIFSINSKIYQSVLSSSKYWHIQESLVMK